MGRRGVLLVLFLLVGAPVSAARSKGRAKIALTISQPQGAPGDVLTIAGRALHPKRAFVVFIDGAGRETSVAARTTGAHTIAFPVPPFFDADNFRMDAGTVRVAVRQGSSRMQRPVVDAFQIAMLPATGLAPGTLTVAVLDQLANLAAVTVQDLKTIEAASGGRVDVAQLRASLQEIRQQYLTSKSLFQAVMSGAVPQVAVGQVAGHDVVVDASSLDLMDRLYAAYLLNARYPASRRGRAVFQPLDGTQDIADQFQKFLGSDVATDIAAFANRFQTAGDAAIGVATLGLIVATGEVTIPLAAAAVMGGMLWSATTWVPAAQMAALEGGSHLMIEDQVSPGDFRESTQFLFERGTSKLIDGFAEKMAAAATGADELVKVEKHLLDVAEAMISDAPHVVRDVKRHYKVTMRGLSGCAVPGCCPARRPIDCQTFCCDSAHPVCGDEGSCIRSTTTTTTLPHCSNPSYPVPCGGFCCPAGSACDGSGCCGGQFPVACTDYCRTPGSVCGQGSCSDPCPPSQPVACGSPIVCCVAGSVCGRDCNTTSTTIPGPGGSGWCDPIGVGTCVACSSDTDCVTFLGGTGRCTFHCNPGGTNPCPSSCP